MRNQELAKIFYEISEYLEMEDVAFKPRAYEKVAQALETLDEDVGDMYKKGGLKALEDIPGVGSHIALKMEELLKTGKLQYYEDLKKKMPVDVESLTAIEGVGPKMIKVLWQKLKIRTISDLERAVKTHKLQKLPGFGEKTEQKILKGIAFRRQHGGRFFLGEALPFAREIARRLQDLKEVKKVAIAGSLRRKKETVGDGDILVVSDQPRTIADFFASMPEVIHVYGKGNTKVNVRIRIGMDLDLRIVPEESFGAALNYFTGSKAHNVALRQIAITKGWKLNEYGLFKGRRMIAGRTEEELYRKLGFPYIEPELREDTGELEAAKKGKLPRIVGYDDLLGDLQIQTDWTDGAHSIHEMAIAAKRLGLEYIAVTDHTKRLAMTRGLDEKRILKQMAEIDRLNKKLRGVTILKGTEVDILPDGTLDLPDKILSQLDVVGASVHSAFKLSRRDQTERIIKAMSNPRVDILFHPTGRIVGKREPYDVDMPEIIRAAKKTGTVLEANALERLDLKDEHIHMAVHAGVKIAINSDAHSTLHLLVLEYGIAQARRGWAEKKDVINAWPLKKMRSMLKK